MVRKFYFSRQIKKKKGSANLELWHREINPVAYARSFWRNAAVYFVAFYRKLPGRCNWCLFFTSKSGFPVKCIEDVDIATKHWSYDSDLDAQHTTRPRRRHQKPFLEGINFMLCLFYLLEIVTTCRRGQKMSNFVVGFCWQRLNSKAMVEAGKTQHQIFWFVTYRTVLDLLLVDVHLPPTCKPAFTFCQHDYEETSLILIMCSYSVSLSALTRKNYFPSVSPLFAVLQFKEHFGAWIFFQIHSSRANPRSWSFNTK